MILPGNKENENTLPKIIYEEMKGQILIEGRSIDVEADKYYSDFLPYLDEQLSHKPIDVVADINYDYFNTVTAKTLVKFFTILKKHEQREKKVTINWYYEKDDDNILQAGEDYQDICELKFNFIEKPNFE